MRLRALLFSALGAFALAVPAHADTLAVRPDGLKLIDDAELSELRGGFAVGGYDINFGAVVRTYIDGAPALSTSVTWTDAGSIVNQTISATGQNIADLTQEQRNALGIGGLDHAGGVVINDAAGMTALVHNIADGVLQNILINSASGRTITQDVDVTLSLPGFEVIQNALDLERFGLHLSQDLNPGG